MLTAETSLSNFLKTFADEITQLCLSEGFMFEARETTSSVTVRCTLPDGYTRFIVFDDHRIENPHGEKQHVCNQWHKGLGDPISFTLGKNITDTQKVSKIISACAMMCITQTEAYKKIKEAVFA